MADYDLWTRLVMWFSFLPRAGQAMVAVVIPTVLLAAILSVLVLRYVRRKRDARPGFPVTTDDAAPNE